MQAVYETIVNLLKLLKLFALLNHSKAYYNLQKAYSWIGGWIGKWVYGWMDGKAVLRIAEFNQKNLRVRYLML